MSTYSQRIKARLKVHSEVTFILVESGWEFRHASEIAFDYVILKDDCVIMTTPKNRERILRATESLIRLLSNNVASIDRYKKKFEKRIEAE